MPLCQWTPTGHCVHSWAGNYRVRDCRITGDGRRLVVISFENHIHVYDLQTYEEEYSLPVNVGMTCLSISRDSRYLLVNLINGEVQMWDIQTAKLVQRYVGQKQGTFTIRSVFGGANESFIASGSEGRLSSLISSSLASLQTPSTVLDVGLDADVEKIPEFISGIGRTVSGLRPWKDTATAASMQSLGTRPSQACSRRHRVRMYDLFLSM